MKGLELGRAYFEACGLPMLKEQFAELLPLLAAGFAGSGSECFGYDDETSQDHDFEPGFCIFLPEEDVLDRRSAFLLERAYDKLPKEFMGFSKSLMKPVGGTRRGVIRLSDFLLEKTGTKNGRLTLERWLLIPEQSLAEAINGEIYFDNYGELSLARKELSRYPKDVRLKKLAGNLLLMAQSGQYNYLRCLSHKEEAAAQLAVFEFVKSCTAAIFLLNNRYQPYYKWSFRALRELDKLSFAAELMEFLLTTDNGPETADEKARVIEGLASDVIEELKSQNITKAVCEDLEKHAYSVNDLISEPELRNMHILAGVKNAF